MSLAIARTSPFDSIRHTDESGEYWLARDLMPLLGYPRWADFKDAIERAKASCKNTGNQVTEHFSGLSLKNPSSKQGRRYQDFKLSRYASYLVAMNGDPSKTEIAAAQSYFVAKAREAEVVIPAQNAAISELDKQIELLKLQLELRKLDSTMLTLHGAELTLTLRGKEDQLVRVETLVTEVVEPATGRTSRILTSDQIKKEIKARTGQTIPSLKWVADQLRKLNRDDLLVPVTRHTTSEYLSPENLDEAINLIFGQNKQMLLVGVENS